MVSDWSSWIIGPNVSFLSEYWSGASQIWSSLLQQSCWIIPWLGWWYLSPLVWGCYHNSQTDILRWWFVVLSHRIQSIPRSCKPQVLLTHSPSFFYLLDLYKINLNWIISLSTSLFQHLYLSCHTWISCLRFFFVLCFWVDLRLVTSFQIVPCCRTWLACLLFFSALVGKVSPAIFLYWSAIYVLSSHKVAGDGVYVSPISQIRSHVVFLVEIRTCFS